MEITLPTDRPSLQSGFVVNSNIHSVVFGTGTERLKEDKSGDWVQLSIHIFTHIALSCCFCQSHKTQAHVKTTHDAVIQGTDGIVHS
jgi:hypothetical protein